METDKLKTRLEKLPGVSNVEIDAYLNRWIEGITLTFTDGTTVHFHGGYDHNRNIETVGAEIHSGSGLTVSGDQYIKDIIPITDNWR